MHMLQANDQMSLNYAFVKNLPPRVGTTLKSSGCIYKAYVTRSLGFLQKKRGSNISSILYLCTMTTAFKEDVCALNIHIMDVQVIDF